jgi:hypothetical protein
MTLAVSAESTAVLARIPEVVRVQEVGGIGSHDIGSWLVQAAIAFGAAWLGAVLGATATRKVTFEAKAAELREDWRRRRSLMIRRLSGALALNKSWSLGVVDHSPELPFSPALVEGARHIWSRYCALVDDLFLLANLDLVKRIEAYFIRLNALATMLEDLEAQRVRELTTSSVTGESVENRIRKVESGTKDRRARMIEHLREADREGTDLLRDYDQYVESRIHATTPRGRGSGAGE